MLTIRRVTLLITLALATPVVLSAIPTEAFVARPEAKTETAPATVAGDSYDDSAIWIHPTEAAKSLILGTNKKGGLHVFDADGKPLQIVNPTAHPNNVDVLYGFPLNGERVDLAVAGCREKGKACVRVWRIDATKRELVELTDGNGIAVFGAKKEPYGSCTYRSPKTGKFYFFVNEKSGGYEQHELTTTDGKLTAKLVRTFKLDSIAEGCVADEETGVLYAAEEKAGVWKLDAEPDANTDKTLIAKVGENGLTADVEGLAIYYAKNGGGYLIASSQGNNTFKLYTRTENRFVGTIDPKPGKLGSPTDTDGIAVTNRPTSAAFPNGVFVVQDGTARKDGQRFKLYAWEDIAGDRLVIDPNWNPRRKGD
ncbi:3-phytase : 3-phytase (Myo-inositol-hexaphosphate 3-phosphohydrolase) OS=Singulisphaera acidiphila (strain ATCC BAA-1392 / DSM 18658 / VKM B-2454 / MOB10) GN=Sinac_3868 PE=4 SV=1: Phytase [Gemmata massiliana]|uniref:BPP domain-containing protein n=1 Tax=Gemmata massiliana TaxID=1210884 RepID=A0A6P2DIJ6_9BACT|nr:phytase [Gemmata massiliana]VTS02840.1 3-phytase : 3-phytase (Myo-inositol-hexaphosphate 3-phosphohydrolase) OS=Singulisphaera acidiphila (strain ATCC BAA-1392 / DSM 18658 / VKM B-2454 / MOB10) GN=Sinac_3868 PE=4 SV=1: Phytase [Gemmata massiliana]